MPANQRSRPGVWGEALADPRDMAKAGCLKPNLQKAQFDTRRKDARNRRRPCRRLTTRLQQASGAGAMPRQGIQGDERDAYVTLDTYSKDERGIACRARALWRHSAVVVAGVTTCQGGREGRPQAKGTGDRTPTRADRYAKCKTPKRCWVSSVTAAAKAFRATSCIDSCSTRSCICWPTAASTPTRGR